MALFLVTDVGRRLKVKVRNHSLWTYPVLGGLGENMSCVMRVNPIHPFLT